MTENAIVKHQQQAALRYIAALEEEIARLQGAVNQLQATSFFNPAPLLEIVESRVAASRREAEALDVRIVSAVPAIMRH